MKKIMEKAVCFFMISLLVFGITGCASNSSEKAEDKSTGDSKEEVTISFWHIWPTGDVSNIIAEFIEQYEIDHPHIKIKADATQAEEYQHRKLKVAAANGSQADVFMCYGGGYAKPYVEAGVILPLDDYLEADKTKERLLGGVLEYFQYEGKTYGVPLKKWAGVLYCNTEIFEENNVKYPETWEELMTAVETFKKNGITPITLGAKDAWHIGMIQNALAVRTAGVLECNKALAGEASLDTAQIEQSAQLLVDLNNAGAFPNGTLGISSDEANLEFLLGNTAMYYCGSWVAMECENEENEIKGKVKVMPMPAIENGKGDINAFMGGAIDGLMVNANTKHKEESIKFALALAEHLSTECYKIGDSIPAWNTDIDESEVNPVLVEIKKLTQDATGYVLAWDTFLEGSAIDAHYNLLQGLIGGTVTPKEFAAGMQKANEEQRQLMRPVR